MAMKRIDSEAKAEQAYLKPIKQVSEFDDSSIRKMLRIAYDDFAGDELELQMENYSGLERVSGLACQSERAGTGLSHLLDRADLRLFWDMHVQKQIHFFDQESSLLVTLPQEEKW